MSGPHRLSWSEPAPADLWDHLTPEPLDPLLDGGHGALAGKVAAVATGARRQALLTDAEVDVYREHQLDETTGTRLWLDPQVGTYVLPRD